MNYLKDLESIVNINSHTKNKEGVDSVALLFTSWMKELDFETTVYENKEIGNHYLYKSEYKQEHPRFLLLGHNDTVFPPNTFEGFTQDDTWVYGPGVCDMKGGNIVALEALRNIYKKNKVINNIDFLLVSDEETGSENSKEITSSLAKNYDYCFVFEAAGESLEIVNERKGVGTFYIDIKGKAAHAGNCYTQGVDANLEASYKIQELVKLTNLDVGTTCNVGEIKGGIGANTISPNARITLEIRYTQTSEKTRLLEALNSITNTSYIKDSKSSLSGNIQRDVMQKTDLQDEFILKLENILDEKLKIEKRGGVSDANIVSSMGTPTLDGFGPFGDGDHTIKERALKSSFEQRIEMIHRILNFYQELITYKRSTNEKSWNVAL